MASKKSYWWLRDMDVDNADWVPILNIVAGELRLNIATGIRVRWDCPGRNGGEFVHRGAYVQCYPNGDLLAEMFSEDPQAPTPGGANG